MRQYQPIWEQVKKHGTATLVAPAQLHPRIIQAVRKEKWMDVGFKLLLSEKKVKMKLKHECDAAKSIITFTLSDVSGIRVEDL